MTTDFSMFFLGLITSYFFTNSYGPTLEYLLDNYPDMEDKLNYHLDILMKNGALSLVEGRYIPNMEYINSLYNR